MYSKIFHHFLLLREMTFLMSFVFITYEMPIISLVIQMFCVSKMLLLLVVNSIAMTFPSFALCTKFKFKKIYCGKCRFNNLKFIPTSLTLCRWPQREQVWTPMPKFGRRFLPTRLTFPSGRMTLPGCWLILLPRQWQMVMLLKCTKTRCLMIYMACELFYCM